MPRPLMVIKLKLHPFHISHLFLNVIWNLIFQHLYPLKLAEIVVKCEIEMRPAPPPSLMNSGHRSKLKVVLALRFNQWNVLCINNKANINFLIDVIRPCSPLLTSLVLWYFACAWLSMKSFSVTLVTAFLTFFGSRLGPWSAMVSRDTNSSYRKLWLSS